MILLIFLGVLLALVCIGFIALLIYHLHYSSEYPKTSVRVITQTTTASGPASFVAGGSSATCPIIGIRYRTTDEELIRVFQALQKTMSVLQAKECAQIRDLFEKIKVVLFQKIDADPDITKQKCEAIINDINLELDKYKFKFNPTYDATVIINELKNAYKQVLDILCVNGTVNKGKLKWFIEQVVVSICPK